eukprot:PhM_4_TR12757/c0_g2_i1/m.28122
MLLQLVVVMVSPSFHIDVELSLKCCLVTREHSNSSHNLIFHGMCHGAEATHCRDGHNVCVHVDVAAGGRRMLREWVQKNSPAAPSLSGPSVGRMTLMPRTSCRTCE